MLRGQTVRRSRIAARAILAMALLGGCRDREGTAPPASPRSAEAVRQALNASPKVSDFALEASNSIAFRTASSVGTLVTGGDVGARGTGAGPEVPRSVQRLAERVVRFLEKPPER